MLRVLNEKPVWSLQELQAHTGLPKSTLHRLLSTLQQEHYVRCDEGMYGNYQLTSNVKELSKGVTESSALVDIAGPILIATTKRIRWPLSLGTVDGDEIRVAFCTMPYSPYAIRPSSYGRRYDLFESALGKTYFTYCGRAERRILFDLYRNRHAGSSRAGAWARLLGCVQETRRQGYGTRYGRRPAESSAFAVPVFAEDQLLATLCYSAFSRSLDARLIEEFLPVLRETADMIGARWAATLSQTDPPPESRASP